MIKPMKQKMFLLAVLLISTYSLYGQKPTEEDPNLLWQTTDPLGYSGFVIHPNGNIIAYRNTEFFEIDGSTGQVIKTIPVFVGIDINAMDVTKDGKILGAGYGNIILYDLENDTVIGGVSETNGLFSFFPDNKRFIARTTNGFGSNLMIYNLETKEKIAFGVNYVVWAVSTSSDGKYFATGGTSRVGTEPFQEDYTHLTLWDAVTLKPIKELAKISGDFEVRSIKFSPDGKYVGFHKSLVDILIYDTENYDMVNQFKGSGAFSLFSNHLIGMYANPGIVLQDFKTNERIFETSNFSTGAYYFVHFNSFNNTLVYGGGILRALDLNKILTSVNAPFKQNTFSANFNKGTLILTGLNSISGQINLTISDITGRVIQKLDSPVVTSELRIPLKLPNGTYLVHIQDGSKEYSSKFLVTE